MKVVCDIECDALESPTNIWLIVCKDIETEGRAVFRNVTLDPLEKERFLEYASHVSLWIGHNFLGYDYPVMRSLLGFSVSDVAHNVLDTLIISKLVDYPRQGHSIEDYGEEFKTPKGKFVNFSKYSQEMEDYCVRDVDICHRIYLKYIRYINTPIRQASIHLEHRFQMVVNSLHDNGFAFNTKKAEQLLEKVKGDLDVLDKEIQRAFPPVTRLVREIHPRVTGHGTLHKGDFRFVKDGDLSEFNGGPFSRFTWEEFNPSSHKQIIAQMHHAGWSPTEKTQTHVDTEREVNKLKYNRNRDNALDTRLQAGYDKLKILEKSGWKINEVNLETLPPDAPPAAKTLAKRILLESRRRTLTEWLGLVKEDGRIHGSFYGLGAWTHRMSHQRPNTANIPNEFDTQGRKKLLGKEMRSLWIAPKNRLLVGVDAEGIQLRIFAHYIDDKEFTDALVRGRKADKTDPHSLNQRILGSACRSRAAAKRFIYALLLGAGLGKLAQILECSLSEAEEALDRLLDRYGGFARLKLEVIPKDAARGWFEGLDNRAVKIPGDTVSQRKHLCMSGYLQNGEQVVMKLATIKWLKELEDEAPQVHSIPLGSRGIGVGAKPLLVNFVHDEWQVETSKDLDKAIQLAETLSSSLRKVGEDLKLKCPLAGSYWSDEHNDYTISTNWSKTH